MLPSVATRPDERWATDLCRVWAGQDGWLTPGPRHRLPYPATAGLASFSEREGQHRRCSAETALSSPVLALKGGGGNPFELRSNNGLVFTSRYYTRLFRRYRLKQEFITPHCPQQNGMLERVIRTLKEQCVHRSRFKSPQNSMRVIGDWISFYNNRRPH